MCNSSMARSRKANLTEKSVDSTLSLFLHQQKFVDARDYFVCSSEAKKPKSLGNEIAEKLASEKDTMYV